VEEPKKQFDENKWAFWSACFNIKQTPTMQFGFSLHTDGVGVSIAYNKAGQAVTNREKQKERKGVVQMDSDDDSRSNQVLRPIDIPENTRIIAVDPGKRDLYTSVEDVDGADKHRVRQYSGKRWMHESGGNKAKRKRESWSLKTGKKYDRWLKSMPTAKVATSADMLKHIAHLNVRFKQCMEVNGQKKVRRLRFTNYVKRQRALSRMCDEFLHDGDGTVNKQNKKIVVFGDAKFQATGPVTKLRKQLRLRDDVHMVDFDEFRTSLLANCCAHDDSRDKENQEIKEEKNVEVEGPLGALKPGATKRSRIHGVRICNNCRKTWNRDVNAALNMLHLFHFSQNNGGKRAYRFSRACPKSKGKRTRKRKAPTTKNTTKKRNTTDFKPSLVLPTNNLLHVWASAKSACQTRAAVSTVGKRDRLFEDCDGSDRKRAHGGEQFILK